MPPFSRVLLAPVLLIALVGCKLIDQTTFGPDSAPDQAADVAPASVRPANQVALVTVRYYTSNPSFQNQLAFAVRATEQRRPGAQYDVIGVSTAADAAPTGRDSEAIMSAIAKLGVADTRIHLGARINPAQTVREVRVYLR